MTATWTEAFSSFTPAGTGWQNYDLYTNKSVPKGAVAYIICANGNDTTDIFMGVRTDGSSLERRINLHEAEDGGYTLYGMYVTCDASTGYIETYADSTSDAIFYLMGYWTGAPFTERWDSFAGTSASAWNQFTCDKSFPASCAVQTVIISKAAASSRTMGCRSGDSTTNRQFTFHEAEGTDADACEPITWMVKLNASKEFGAFIHVIADNPVYVTGYFDPSYLNYVETARNGVTITTASSWLDWDATSLLDEDGRVLDCFVLHKNYAEEQSIGFRVNGSSLDRYISCHEAEHTSSTYYTGYFVPTATDASGIVEVYTTDATNEWMGMWGYYVPVPHYDRSTTDAVALSESITITKSIKVSETIGLAEAVILTKSIIVTDSIGLADATALSKSMLVTDSIGAADSVGPWSKALLTADTISLADVSQLVKALIVSDGITLTDAAILIKELYVSDGIALADAITRTIIGGLTEIVVTDNIGLSDSVVLGKSMLTADTLTLTDAVKLSKVLILTDDIALSDTAKLLKSILVADTISLADAVALVKSITVADGITLTDAATRGSAITVLLNLIAIRGRRDKESLLGRKDGETLTGRKDSETSNNRG